MRFLLVVVICIALASPAHAREFWAQGKGYEYSFSDVQGWVGIGQDLENFPQADMVFYAAERKGEDIDIRHLYTELYVFSNVTTGGAEGFWKVLEAGYRRSSPKLIVERAGDIAISEKLSAKVIYLFNIGPENVAQAMASIPNGGRVVSLVMQASSEKLLREHVTEFSRLVRTYKASGGGKR